MSEAELPIGTDALALRSDEAIARAITDPERLRALHRTRLLDAPTVNSFARATRMASRQLEAPVSLVTLIDAERQFFASSVGLPPEIRETPLTHSACKYVAANGQPLVVGDARKDAIMASNGVVRDFGVLAYCGVPLVDDDGHVLGSICVMDLRTREWSTQDLDLLCDLAETLRMELTLRRALEEAQTAERRRRDMLSVLSHDLRSPLSVVASASATLQMYWDRIDEDARVSMLRTLERQGRNATALIERLLTAEGRAPEPRPIDLDVVTLANDVVNARGITAPDISMSVVGCDTAPARLDPVLTGQIMANLVDNAVAHAGEGITVQLAIAIDGDDVVIHVTDDGIGIPPESRDSIFERFVRGKESSGHGLGLHIVRMQVQAMHGSVEVESQIPGGTTFTVRLPTTPVAPPADLADAAGSAGPTPPSSIGQPSKV